MSKFPQIIVTIKQRPRWRRILLMPSVFIGHYRILRKRTESGWQNSRYASAFAAWTLTMLMLKNYK